MTIRLEGKHGDPSFLLQPPKEGAMAGFDQEDRHPEGGGYSSSWIDGYRRLRLSVGDRVWSLLVATILLLFAICVVLFLVWLQQFSNPFVESIQLPGAQAWQKAAESDPFADLAEVAPEEFPELMEARLADAKFSVTPSGVAQGAREGKVTDLPDVSIGSLREIQRDFRWQLRYRVGSIDQYRSLLQRLGVQLVSVPRQSPDVVYGWDFYAGQRIAIQAEKDQRVHLLQSSRPYYYWDRQILRNHGVWVSDHHLVVQFLPAATIEKMIRTERSQVAADQKTLEDIRETIFVIDESESAAIRLEKIKYY